MENDEDPVFGFDHLSLRSSEDGLRLHHHPNEGSKGGNNGNPGGDQVHRGDPHSHLHHVQNRLNYFPPPGQAPLPPLRYNRPIDYPDYYSSTSSSSSISMHSQNVVGYGGLEYNFPTSSHASYQRTPSATNIHIASLPPFTLPPGIDTSEAEMLLRRANNLSSGTPVKLSTLPMPLTGEKPAYPYSTLIQLAIWESPEKRLTLQEIYAAILKKFPAFREQGDAWQRSIRHTLSLKKAFVNQGRDRHDLPKGRGAYWELDIQNLVGNKRQRKRGPSKSAKAEEGDDEEVSDAGDEPPPPPSPKFRSSSVSGSVDRSGRTRYAQSSSTSRHGVTSRRSSPSKTQQTSTPVHLFPPTPNPALVSDQLMYINHTFADIPQQHPPHQTLSPPPTELCTGVMDLSHYLSMSYVPAPAPLAADSLILPNVPGRSLSPRPPSSGHHSSHSFSRPESQEDFSASSNSKGKGRAQ
ncbi:brain factor 1 [Moniliophthora roreri MCA 2997]|uniref:Brain factor 1 n=1 Tax=Moniliophthora roreri (strain MCA 2997) TaxID=1381753 RepID=V2X9H4_MONRO|nr:brain factor 1 [Moniliophthora roreri MCA 2997]